MRRAWFRLECKRVAIGCKSFRFTREHSRSEVVLPRGLDSISKLTGSAVFVEGDAQDHAVPRSDRGDAVLDRLQAVGPADRHQPVAGAEQDRSPPFRRGPTDSGTAPSWKGDATGHCHRVEDLATAQVFQRRDELYLRVVSETGRIIHPEHGPITLPRGTYRVWKQREYAPGMIRWVEAPDGETTMYDVLCYLRTPTVRQRLRGATDDALLRRFAAGRDESAFTALVERHGPFVLGLCHRLLRNEQDAEDVLQATFLVLARQAGSIRNGSFVACWLYGVARRRAVRRRDEAARRRARERQAAAREQLIPTDALTVEEVQVILDEELQRLLEAYRAPILLCCLRSLSRDEVARELGWPEGAVKIRLERGRRLLRERLARRGVVLSAALTLPLLAGTATAAVSTTLARSVTQAAVMYAAGESVAGLASDAAVTLAGAFRAP